MRFIVWFWTCFGNKTLPCEPLLPQTPKHSSPVVSADSLWWYSSNLLPKMIILLHILVSFGGIAATKISFAAIDPGSFRIM